MDSEEKLEHLATTLAEITVSHLELQERHRRLTAEFAAWRAWVCLPAPAKLQEKTEVAKAEDPSAVGEDSYESFRLANHEPALGFNGCKWCKMTLVGFFLSGTKCRSNPHKPVDEVCEQPAIAKPAKGHKSCNRCGRAKSGQWMEKDPVTMQQTGRCLTCAGKSNPTTREMKANTVETLTMGFARLEYMRICERCRKSVDTRQVAYYAAKCQNCWSDQEAPDFMAQWKKLWKASQRARTLS